jgi:hypothetical protein
MSNAWIKFTNGGRKTDRNPIACPKCRALHLDDMEYVEKNGFIIAKKVAHCKQCGENMRK